MTKLLHSQNEQPLCSLLWAHTVTSTPQRDELSSWLMQREKGRRCLCWARKGQVHQVLSWVFKLQSWLAHVNWRDHHSLSRTSYPLGQLRSIIPILWIPNLHPLQLMAVPQLVDLGAFDDRAKLFVHVSAQCGRPSMLPFLYVLGLNTPQKTQKES